MRKKRQKIVTFDGGEEGMCFRDIPNSHESMLARLSNMKKIAVKLQRIVEKRKGLRKIVAQAGDISVVLKPSYSRYAWIHMELSWRLKAMYRNRLIFSFIYIPGSKHSCERVKLGLENIAWTSEVEEILKEKLACLEDEESMRRDTFRALTEV